MAEIMNNNELKQCLLNILIAFADYCDKYELNYILIDGTLLGAIRHQGFIPWDDDIDVFMPREDYDKFHKIVEKEPIKNNYILESLLIGNSPNPYAKVVDKNTEIINAKSDINNSLWIDIFPVDGVSQEMVDNISAVNKKLWREYMLLTKSSNRLTGLNSVSQLIKTLYAKFTGTPKKHGKKLDKYARRYSVRETPYAANIAWGDLVSYMEYEKLFENRIKVSFENHMFYTTGYYEEYLEKMYGDYMQIPPENERDTHNIIARYINEG